MYVIEGEKKEKEKKKKSNGIMFINFWQISSLSDCLLCLA